MSVFSLDGTDYNVHVTSLTRKFAVLDTDAAGRTLDGCMYRDVIGTFYHYAMTVEPKNGDTAAMDAFWDAISQPKASFVCTFPYNQRTLTQRMYVTAGQQDMRRITGTAAHWGSIALEFVAMEPRVTP